MLAKWELVNALQNTKRVRVGVEVEELLFLFKPVSVMWLLKLCTYTLLWIFILKTAKKMCYLSLKTPLYLSDHNALSQVLTPLLPTYSYMPIHHDLQSLLIFFTSSCSSYTYGNHHRFFIFLLPSHLSNQ